MPHGFESHPLRQKDIKWIIYKNFALEKYPRGRRGSPAKGVGVLKRARVQIPPSPPTKKHAKACFFVGERCVPLTRNVMHTSCVMYPSDVMFAFGKWKGTHHITDCVAIYITTAKAVTSLARIAQTSLYNRASARFFIFTAKSGWVTAKFVIQYDLQYEIQYKN